MESKEIDEITRRVSVLVESVRSDVRLVAEGLSGLTDTVGQLAERIDRLDRRLRSVHL